MKKKILSLLLSITLIISAISICNVQHVDAAIKTIRVQNNGVTNVTIKKDETKTIKLKKVKYKVKWKVIKGKSIINITKKSGKYKNLITIKGKKKGFAIIQAKAGKKRYKIKIIVKNNITNKTPVINEVQTEESTSKVVEEATTESGTKKEEVTTKIDSTTDETTKYNDTTNLGIISGQCGQNATYSYDNLTNVLKICGNGAMYDYFPGSDESPWISGGYNVKEVIVEEGISSVGEYAFDGCKTLESVTISGTVKTIEPYAFVECVNLKSLTIPKNVETIGTYAFGQCRNLEEVTISNGVTRIEDYAFRDCIKLTGIVIPDSVTKIGDRAFENCRSLEDIHLPENISLLGDEAFSGTGYYLNDENWVSGVLYIDKYLIEARKTKGFNADSYAIKEGTITIGEQAFREMEQLQSVVMPESILYICDDAFWGCSNLKSVNLPKGLNRIETSAFSNCSSLTEIIIPDSVSYVGFYAFSGCSGLIKMQIPCSTKYEDSSFYNVYNLEKIRITKGTGIMCSYEGHDIGGNDLVYYKRTPWYTSRNNIKELILEEGITNIGDEAFREMPNMANVEIPGSVKRIGEAAFFYCDDMEIFVIPEGVERIEECAFSYCGKLKKVTIPNSVTYLDPTSFNSSDNLTEIITSNEYVIESLGEKYKIVSP